MIFLHQPENFSSRFDVVGCFVEWNGKILLLRRQDNKQQADTWGIPGGKIDEKEDCAEGIRRELREETGIMVDLRQFTFIKSVYVRFSDYDFIYHMFRLTITEKPMVTINPDEHKEYVWVTVEEALQMNFIEDLDSCIYVAYPQVAK